MSLTRWNKEFDQIYKKLEAEGITKEALLDYVANLEYLCARHFEEEDAKMRQADFPLTDYHKARHDHMKKALADLRIRIKAEDDEQTAAVKVCETYSRLISDHVEKEDSAFQMFLSGIDLILDKAYAGCILEVIQENNNMLGTGVIETVARVMTVRNKGQAPIPAKPNDKVKLNVFHPKEGFKVWEARVVSCDIDELQFTNVRLLTSGNKRTFFRVKTDIKAKLEIMDEERSMMFLDPMNINIMVEDLSLGGLCFSSDLSFEPGDRIIVSLELYKEETKLECLVVRIIPGMDGSAPKYGCKFFDYSLRHGDMLAKFVVDHQRAMALRGR